MFCLGTLSLDALTLDLQGRDHLTHEKKTFAHEHPQMKRLEDVVRELKPTAIIGKQILGFCFKYKCKVKHVGQ